MLQNSLSVYNVSTRSFPAKPFYTESVSSDNFENRFLPNKLPSVRFFIYVFASIFQLSKISLTSITYPHIVSTLALVCVTN